MKNRIVLWGTDENEKKILLGLELLTEENKVRICTFNEEQASEAFYTQMMNQWRNNEEISFPEGYKEIVKDLSVTEELLPESIRVKRTDLINQAKTEWHFSVLSSKMYQMYKSEVDSIKDKVEQLTNYDKEIWNEMKVFWSKVQGQVREKNLYREHANTLRSITDEVFEILKKLRKSLDAEFEKLSANAVETFFGKLDVIEGKIDKGLGLKPIFDELKNVQSEFRDTKFTKGDRKKVWDRLDKAFKVVKEKRFGDKGGEQSASSRLQRRYNGLMSAIDKMEKSIKRDKNDKSFQDKRINQSDGQLETQLRQAKVKMIDERISSKELKLADMMKTKLELENKMAQEKKREAKREEKAKIEEAKKDMKEKVKAEIQEKQEQLDPAKKEKLEKAASEISDSKGMPKDGLLGAIATVAGEALEDVVDTVKAVKEVVEDKIEEVVEAVKEELPQLENDEEKLELKPLSEEEE